MKLKLLYLSIFLFLILYITINVFAQISSNIKIEQDSIKSGDNLLISISLFQFGSQKIQDLKVIYYITTPDELIISEGLQTIALQYQSSLVGNLYLPENLKGGGYTLFVQVIDPRTNKILSESSKKIFLTADVKTNKYNLFFYKVQNNKENVFAIILITISFFIFILVTYSQHRKYKNLRQEYKITTAHLINYIHKNQKRFSTK